MKSLKVLLVILLFLSASQIFCQDINSPGNRLKFGNKLFQDKDYLRAIDEFKAYLRTTDDDTVRFNIARSFFGMKKYSEASDYFKSLFSSFTLQDEARFGVIKSVFFSGDFNFIRNESLKSPFYTGVYDKEIKRLIGITYLLDKAAVPVSTEMISLFPSEVQPKLLQFIQAKNSPPYKNSTTAALLSALVPGLGKIYTGEYTDGLIAFAATGLSVFLAVDSFNSGSNFKGWLFTGLGAFFYGGSIYGSAASAQNYNAGIRLNFENELNLFLGGNNFFLPKEKF